MATRFEGSLQVKKINGHNGAFCIGELVTDIGVFKVKDPLIDQFEDGTYQGSFWVSRIYPYTYCAYGKVIIQIQAKLEDLQIDGESDLPADADLPQEPDPLEEPVIEKPVKAPRPLPKPSAKPDSRERQAQSTSTESQASARETRKEDDDLALFGEELFELIRLGKPLKLDSTIDRMQLRRQIHRLGLIGYAFTAMTQTWSKADSRPASD